MNEEVKSILSNLKVDNKVIPVEHIKYTGKSKTFVTWALLDGIPALSGDNEIICSIEEVDIDVFSDSNYLDIIKEIKRLMKNGEWMWSGDSPEMFEEDTGLYHRTVTFQKERMIIDG